MTREHEQLRALVREAFQQTMEQLTVEVAVMPLERWNESVFRYAFCRSIASSRPDVDQLVECDRIDLVLRAAETAAFIEFKLYQRRRRVDAYTGAVSGSKGGPGQQNLREFQRCVDQLHARPSSTGLSKLIVLVYSDPPADASDVRVRFSDYLDDYRHPDADVPLVVEDRYGPVDADGSALQAVLFELRATP